MSIRRLAESFEKHSSGIITKAISYSSDLPSGVTVSSGTASAIDLVDGTSATGTVLSSPTATTNSTSAAWTFQAGTDGHRYLVTLETTLSNGNKIIDQVLMIVRNII